MNSREPGHINQQFGTGRAARLRRRRRKRIALFASFAVIIILIVLAIVLLALEIAEASGKLNNGGNSETTASPGGETDTSPSGKYIAAQGDFSIYEGTLILVNSSHEYVFPSTEARLANIFDSRSKDSSGNYPYMCSFNTLRMDRTALSALNKFMEAFYAATKNEYALISDAYRTYDEQAAKNSTIKAGFSDHHTGYLVSVKFYDTVKKITYTSDSAVFADAYTWLNEHAAEYGFVLRYPSNKSSITGVSDYTYCYRYVGMAHAAYMSANNLCLEEYVSLLKTSYTFDGVHLNITDKKGVSYEVYYIPKTGDNTAIYVPASSGGYEISGDNEGGYIVTVTLN